MRYSLTLAATALPPAIAEELHAAQSGSVAARERLLQVVRDKVSLTDAAGRCVPGPGFAESSAPGVDNLALTVDFVCPARVTSLIIRDDVFDILGRDHHTLARVELPEGTRELAFAPEMREARVTLEGLEQAHGSPRSFFRLGVEHILTGYDHLLFLAALLLRGGGLLSLLKIVTAFTLAHSLTLALAVLGIVTIPDRLVECVIAASIAWVALENVFLRQAPSRRWLVSFAFGLAHGFGFASAVHPLALPPWPLARALIGFNLGVEAGQGVVIALALPLLAWLRHVSWEPRAVRLASLALALIGMVWFVERLFFV